MIAHPTLPVTRQCRILNVSRATVYRHPATAVSDADLELMALIST
jgi:putative transposase